MLIISQEFGNQCRYDIIIRGRVAEWFKALVLKTSVRKHRKFESCPFRQICFCDIIYQVAT